MRVEVSDEGQESSIRVCDASRQLQHGRWAIVELKETSFPAKKASFVNICHALLGIEYRVRPSKALPTSLASPRLCLMARLPM